MLSDNVIHRFNIICRRQFEHVAGLQDPLLGQTSQYSVIKNEKSVQILHNNRTCWVTISTYNCKNREDNTAKNTVISPNFMVWKFCGKAQFPHSFGRIAQNYVETVPFHKISTP